MKEVINKDIKAKLILDDKGRVRSISHFEEYRESDEKTPLLAAIDYLQQMASMFEVPSEQMKNLSQRVSFWEPGEQGIEYRLSEEKQLFDSTTMDFYQTYLNVPVWRAGLKVTIKHNPYRVISSVNTSQEGIDAKLPSMELISYYRDMFKCAELEKQMRRLNIDIDVEKATEAEKKESKTADFVRKLIDIDKLGETDYRIKDQDRLIRGRFYVYKYNESDRLPNTKRQALAETPLAEEPVLPLPPVSDIIKEGHYYVVAEITFSTAIKKFGGMNWLALVELETGSILYLRTLIGFVNGCVFTIDPISASGNATLTSDQNNAVLNPWRSLVELQHLKPPVNGVQSLIGDYVKVINVVDPNIAPPTEPVGNDFCYDVRTNNFAAVNAYYHIDLLFTTVESLGFPISDYFKHTFPAPDSNVRVDHRACRLSNCPDGIVINGYCWPDGYGGIDHVGFMLGDLTDTTNPIGRACDSRVHWHEVCGHGILYEHVDFANFGFCHSAGDSLSLIFHDPISHAPDRFRYAPWNPINLRRCDRNPADGWAWGGKEDDASYGTEEILATTLFRVYQSIGGDSQDQSRREFASRMMLYLILRAVYDLTPTTNPSNVLDFAKALQDTDALNWTSGGVYGGAYNKVIRWSFEKQGLYQAPGAPTPVTTSGLPSEVDVYIDDGRGGEYRYIDVHWENPSIWNRRNPDGGTAHDEPALGTTNYAYVKVKNRGTQTAYNVKVRGYHCIPMAGVLWPNDLQSFTTPELMAPGGGTLLGNEEKTVGPFEWTPVVNAWGHDCMLMIASADGDPSNIDNFTLGEVIQDWRLIPNDNNIGQRNVVLVPGGGGSESLTQALHGFSFWVGNPEFKTSTIELRVQLPEVLVSSGWHLSFKGISDNKFELRSGKKREIILDLHTGKDLDKGLIEKSTNKDIKILTYANGALIGGMTYRLDPALKEAYNLANKPEDANAEQCRVWAWTNAVLLAALVVALGTMSSTAALALAVLLAASAALWMIRCHPKICVMLRTFVAGAGIGAIGLLILGLFGIYSPQLMAVLAAAVVLLIIAAIIGVVRRCF